VTKVGKVLILFNIVEIFWKKEEKRLSSRIQRTSNLPCREKLELASHINQLTSRGLV